MSISRKLKNAASGSADGGGGGGGSAGGYVDDVFSTYVYEGNTAESIEVNNGIDLAGEGGLVWTRERDNQAEHLLIDTERGLSRGYLATDNVRGESLSNVHTSIDSFTNTGYILDGGGNIWNRDGYEYVSWTFRKAPKFFDVVTYTGDGTVGREIPHNLGVEPGMVIFKRTDASSGNWPVYVRSLGAKDLLRLNLPNESFTSSDYFNDTAPTHSSFTVGDSSNINASGGEYVAYLFAHDDSDESMIKCGSYTGNGNIDGPEIDLGFEPQWLMIKGIGGGDWTIFDNMRGLAVGGNDSRIQANLTNEENNGYPYIDLQPTGFKLQGHTGGAANSSGKDYIYMAIRRPSKPAEEFEPEELFDVAYADGSKSPDFKGPLTDFRLSRDITGASSLFAGSRLQGTKYLKTAESEGESPASYSKYDYMDGWGDLGMTSPNTSWMWRRAPGFFDVVCYEGDGQLGREVPHNLGVAPEMMWVKRRKADGYKWYVYHTGLDNTQPENYSINLNESSLKAQDLTAWNSTTPTATEFTLGTRSAVNGTNSECIAYLFASVPGISSVGSYTGTGADLDIDCGFTTGARFVLIKRTDSTGDWYVWDSVRGITVGNDPYLLLNTNDAQVTNTDYIDPLSSGFKVTASAPDAINAANGEYIYMSIA